MCEASEPIISDRQHYIDEGQQQQSARSSRLRHGRCCGGLGSLALVRRRNGSECRHCHPQDSIPLPALSLSVSPALPHPLTPPPPPLFLFHSPNINRVIWMSYIAGKLWWCQLLCADLWVALLENADSFKWYQEGLSLNTSSKSVNY